MVCDIGTSNSIRILLNIILYYNESLKYLCATQIKVLGVIHLNRPENVRDGIKKAYQATPTVLRVFTAKLAPRNLIVISITL